MNYPTFFDEIETITLNDPLASLLGAFEDGKIKFSYLDVVKLSGHSCPTVAGAYLICLKGLKTLYGDKIPVRGEIKIEFPQDISDGVVGVFANVIGIVTGSAAEGGFKGVGGKFSRHSLISFNNKSQKSTVRLIRTDTNKAIDLYYNPQILGGNPKAKELLNKNISETITESEKNEFKKMWQAGVKKILIEEPDNRELLYIELV